MHKRKITSLIVKTADGEPDSGGSGEPDPDAPKGGEPDKGSEWTPPSSQEELDKIITARVARATKPYKGIDIDDLKAKAARADALDNELASETEKAVKAAREEEKKSARSAYAPRLVRTEFRAQAKGVLSADQLDALLEDLDLSKYLTDDDEVDVERIEKKVTALAPPPKEDPPPPRGTDFGQGRRNAPPEKGVDAGRSRYEATHRKSTPPQR
jgi:hypothetical protein